jgi:uncharacterized membrane protein YciS (DUF1049 family)
MSASNTLLKIRVYTKIVLLSLVAIYSLAFILVNTGQTVDLWLFPFVTIQGMNTILALLAAFILGVIVTLLLRTALATWKQLRLSRDRDRTDRLEHEIQEMKLRGGTASR